MRKTSGFTLIELLISVVVIGILVSLSLPTYARAVERSKCAQAMQILQNMRTAGLSFYAENESFSGMTESDLEDISGANFYSDDSNNDWFFRIDNIADRTLVLLAERRAGPHEVANKTDITLTDDPDNGINDQWSDPAGAGNYPWNNPGTW